MTLLDFWNIFAGWLNLFQWMCPEHCTPSFFFRWYVIINGSLTTIAYFIFVYFLQFKLKNKLSQLFGSRWVNLLSAVFFCCAIGHGCHSWAYFHQYTKLMLIPTYVFLNPFIYTLLFTSRKAFKNISKITNLISDKKGLESLALGFSIMNTSYHYGTTMKCLVDDTGYLKDCSQSVNDRLGYSVEHMRTTPFITFVHPDDVDRTMEVYKNEIYKKKTAWEFYNRYRHADGHYLWMEWLGPGERVEVAGKWYTLSEFRIVTEEYAKMRMKWKNT